jgi:hypothetical protein
MKLNPFENSRTFFTRNSQQTVIRDTFVNQSNPPQEEEKPNIEEPKKEVKSEETQIVKKPKTNIKKPKTNIKNIPND